MDEQAILISEKNSTLFSSNREFQGWMDFNMHGNFDWETRYNTDASIKGLNSEEGE